MRAIPTVSVLICDSFFPNDDSVLLRTCLYVFDNKVMICVVSLLGLIRSSRYDSCSPADAYKSIVDTGSQSFIDRYRLLTRIMMRHMLLIVLLFLWFSTGAQAVTYYIGDSGSDTNPGTLAAPWLTWTHAFAKSTCGDTLLVMDGTYTRAKNGGFSLKKTCTASTTYTVKAQNERQAFLSGDGSGIVAYVYNSAYITLQGLRVKNIDYASGQAGSNVTVADSNHITLRRLLVTHNNRYFNNHLIQLTRSPYSVVEENELYFFHRHGIILNATSNAVVRRNYCHARNYADIAGGRYSGIPATGDDCIVVYPGDSNIIENNVSDGSVGKGFSVQASGTGHGNKFYGNIAIGASIGISLDVRGTGLDQMPRDTVIENMVVIGSTGVGIRSRGAKNTICNQCMVLTSVNGIVADTIAGYPGDGLYSFFSNNSLVSGNGTGTGFLMTDQIQTWTMNSLNSIKNLRNYNPVSDSNWGTQKVVDPVLGTCRVWIPAASPMKGAGINGKDIGANILYRYENGELTDVPLWDRATGEFPQGALVTGLNDLEGESLFDLHKRLNINRNGCLFPPDYGKNGSDVNAPTSPVGLRAS